MKRIRFWYWIFVLLPSIALGQYNGSASVTQGSAVAITGNLYECNNGRVARLGRITAADNSVWIVPSEVHYLDTTFPFASDLHNECSGVIYNNTDAAVAALNGDDIVVVDTGGEVITAFIFADNYFEMYINGVAVGKDNVPFTLFNSNIIRFRVKRPFTIAMLLVDWEENLGLGSENNGGFAFHPGDGGMVAVFKDSNKGVVAVTNSSWKAQTFYTAPITDLSCPKENGTLRQSNLCSTANTNNGASYYGLHWHKPDNWTSPSFNDSDWPNAFEFTNEVIGINNKPAYTNFTDIFDDPGNDAVFIWSSNVILDNEVIVRHTVQAKASTLESIGLKEENIIFPNPFYSKINVLTKSATDHFVLSNDMGDIVYAGSVIDEIDFSYLPTGVYYIRINGATNEVHKLIKIQE